MIHAVTTAFFGLRLRVSKSGIECESKVKGKKKKLRFGSILRLEPQ